MKKLFLSFALLAFFGIIGLTSCSKDDDSSTTTPATAPGKITSIAANGAETAISLQWSPADTLTKSYLVSVLDDKGDTLTFDGNTKQLPVSATGATINSLETGKAYTFVVWAVGSTGLKSDPVTITWGTVLIFKDVKLYESKSSFGSGLQLYDPETKQPKNLTVNFYSDWDLGLDTRNSSIDIGSPDKLSYDKASEGKSTLLYIHSAASKGYTSLDQVFDTQALSTGVSQYVTFTDITASFILGVKTADNHFAKVLVKYDNENKTFLHGDNEDHFVLVDISYQPTENLPYAKKK